MISKIANKSFRVARELMANIPAIDKYLLQGQNNCILMYHGVSKENHSYFNKRHTSAKSFETQIKFLKKNANIISVKDFFEQKFNPSKPNFAITFDDGYLNNFLYAKPILEKYQCPATIYITGLNKVGDHILWADYLNIASKLTTENIVIEGEVFVNKNGIYYHKDSDRSLYQIIKHDKPLYSFKQKIKESFSSIIPATDFEKHKDLWALVSDEQIKEMAKSDFVTIGSHGYYHNNLGHIALENAKEEIDLSKAYLEALTQYKINEIAYPDGSYNEAVVNYAKDIGFAYQLATEEYTYDAPNLQQVLKTRRGIYNVDTAINQLLTAISN